MREELRAQVICAGRMTAPKLNGCYKEGELHESQGALATGS